MNNTILAANNRRILAIMLLALLPVFGGALADGNDDDKHVERHGEALPIDDIKEALDVIDSIFGGDDDDKGPERARLQFEVQDWAGRPAEARINLVGAGVRYSRPTTAGRATIFVDRTGTYTASLEVGPSRGRPGAARLIRVDRLGYRGRYVLRILRPTLEDLVRIGRAAETERLANKFPRAVETLVKLKAAEPRMPFTPPGPDLRLGSRVSLQGQVMDQIGRPMEALVIVSRGGRVIGHAFTTASRFTLYDLSPAEYELVALLPPARRGTPRTITLGAATPRVALRVSR